MCVCACVYVCMWRFYYWQYRPPVLSCFIQQCTTINRAVKDDHEPFIPRGGGKAELLFPAPPSPRRVDSIIQQSIKTILANMKAPLSIKIPAPLCWTYTWRRWPMVPVPVTVVAGPEPLNYLLPISGLGACSLLPRKDYGVWLLLKKIKIKKEKISRCWHHLWFGCCRCSCWYCCCCLLIWFYSWFCCCQFVCFITSDKWLIERVDEWGYTEINEWMDTSSKELINWLMVWFLYTWFWMWLLMAIKPISTGSHIHF